MKTAQQIERRRATAEARFNYAAVDFFRSLVACCCDQASEPRESRLNKTVNTLLEALADARGIPDEQET
ncbi:MAG: hypothetical protein HYS12_23535 [Planctomycetes bacterium]|nr:hypothetical protein [Planctomycetota bacterium]